LYRARGYITRTPAEPVTSYQLPVVRYSSAVVRVSESIEDFLCYNIYIYIYTNTEAWTVTVLVREYERILHSVITPISNSVSSEGESGDTRY
jgi:hypothetical protein